MNVKLFIVITVTDVERNIIRLRDAYKITKILSPNPFPPERCATLECR